MRAFVSFLVVPDLVLTSFLHFLSTFSFSISVMLATNEVKSTAQIYPRFISFYSYHQVFRHVVFQNFHRFPDVNHFNAYINDKVQFLPTNRTFFPKLIIVTLRMSCLVTLQNVPLLFRTMLLPSLFVFVFENDCQSVLLFS